MLLKNTWINILERKLLWQNKVCQNLQVTLIVRIKNWMQYSPEDACILILLLVFAQMQINLGREGPEADFQEGYAYPHKSLCYIHE